MQFSTPVRNLSCEIEIMTNAFDFLIKPGNYKLTPKPANSKLTPSNKVILENTQNDFFYLYLSLTSRIIIIGKCYLNYECNYKYSAKRYQICTACRHIIFAPSSVNIYGSSLFPGVSDTIFNAVNFGGSWDEVRRQLDFARNHIRYATTVMAEPSLNYVSRN